MKRRRARISPAPRPLAAAIASLVAALPACAPPPDAPPPERHPSWRRARVLISDGAAGRLQVFDVEEEAVIADLPAGGPASVQATESGDFATLVFPGEGKVGLLRSGVAVTVHDDHLHIYKSTPHVLKLELGGAAPGAVVSRGGRIAIFFDGSAADAVAGQAVVLAEEDLRLSAPETPTFITAGPHRGVGVPAGGRLLLTRPDEDGPPGTAGGIDVVDEDGSLLESLSPHCPALEGAAALGDSAAFACADGLLLVEPAAADGGLKGRKLPYPAGAGGERARRLRSHGSGRTLVGNLGSEALFHMDPASGAGRRLDLGAPICDHALDPSTGEIVALLHDGALGRLQPDGSAPAISLPVVGAFDCAGTAPRPHLALAPGRAYISDPAAGELIEVELAGLSVVARHPVGGVPASIAVLGLTFENIDLGAGTH